MVFRGARGSGWRTEKRKAIRRARREATVRERREPERSPSGRYVLEVTELDTPSGWRFSEGDVKKSGSRRSLARILRNYGHFPFTWIEDHASGHDYLLCGEDYQGQTVIELDTRRRLDHLPDSAEAGFGFCWARHHLAPDQSVLVVEGCYWANPYELAVFDIRDPFALPLPELHRWSGELGDVDGFDESNTLTWTSYDEVCRSDGRPYRELTAEEADDYEASGGKYVMRHFRSQWTLGDPFEETTTHALGDVDG